MVIVQQLTVAIAFVGICSLGSLQAQTVIWGRGSGNPQQDSIGSFSTPDGTLAGAQWTSTSPTSAAEWIWSPDGVSAGTASQNWVAQGTGQWISSPSIATGCALFDSDALDQAGISAPQIAILESPIIDLTGHTDSTLAVQFYLSYLELDIAELSVGFSTDGGTNYTDVDVRPLSGGMNIQAWYNDWLTVSFPNALSGVTNLSNCRLRFTFNGYYYYAAVDDISLIEGYDYDIAFPQSIHTYRNLVPILPAPYRRMPLQQAKFYEPYFYAALVANYGNLDIPAALNPTLHVSIEQDLGTWTEVYNPGAIALGDIPIGDTIMVWADISSDLQQIFSNLPNAVGNYRITYALSLPGQNNPTHNDTVRYEWQITEDDGIYSAAQTDPHADVPLAMATQNIGAYATPPNVTQLFEWGNVYSFWDTTAVYIDSAIYRMVVPASLNPAITELVVKVNWKEVVQSSGVFNNPELRTVYYDTIAITPAMYGTYITRSVPLYDPSRLNPITQQYDLPYSLAANSLGTGAASWQYYLGIEQTNVDGFINIAGQRNYLYPTYASGNPYEWHADYTLDAWTPLTITEGTQGIMGTASLYSGFSGITSTPAQWIRLGHDSLTVGTPRPSRLDLSLRVFPNPTTDQVHLQLDQPFAQATCILSDLQGRVLQVHRLAADQTLHSFSVAHLPAGLYSVQVITDKGRAMQLLMVR